MLVEHGAKEDCHGGVEIEAGGKLAAAPGTEENALDALATGFHDAVAPCFAEFMMRGGVRNERG